jgi:hypothetical protein
MYNPTHRSVPGIDISGQKYQKRSHRLVETFIPVTIFTRKSEPITQRTKRLLTDELLTVLVGRRNSSRSWGDLSVDIVSSIVSSVASLSKRHQYISLSFVALYQHPTHYNKWT